MSHLYLHAGWAWLFAVLVVLTALILMGFVLPRHIRNNRVLLDSILFVTLVVLFIRSIVSEPAGLFTTLYGAWLVFALLFLLGNIKLQRRRKLNSRS
jgi:lipopolysaccharide export LptBFGC system permease protein LptF